MFGREKTALVGAAVLAALVGCASQDSFSLPDLTPPGTVSSAQIYPSYGYGYGVRYPNVYQPGYGNFYGYANPYYAAQGLYPYGSGYAYAPNRRYVVVPCADNNRDGQCDSRPPKKHRDPHGNDDAAVDHPAQPGDGYHGEIPRVRNHVRDIVPNAQQRVVPAPATSAQQPVQVQPAPRRAMPPEAATQRGPRADSGRPSATRNDAVSSRRPHDP